MPQNPPKRKDRYERLDILLVKKGFAKSRERAKSLILSGKVLVNEVKIDKAGTIVRRDSKIRLLGKDHPYVSRGALKILGALEHFKIDPNEFTVIDAGASTGGFTQVLLEKGAKKIYAIDVGYGILDLKLRKNPKVISLEKTNVRYLGRDKIKENVDLITIDLAFISLKKVIPNLLSFLKDGGGLLALIKPQFEVEKGEVEKGGLVKDPEKHKRVISEITLFCQKEMKLQIEGVFESPIKGTDGNIEFFIYCLNKLSK